MPSSQGKYTENTHVLQNKGSVTVLKICTSPYLDSGICEYQLTNRKMPPLKQSLSGLPPTMINNLLLKWTEWVSIVTESSSCPILINTYKLATTSDTTGHHSLTLNWLIQFSVCIKSTHFFRSLALTNKR